MCASYDLNNSIALDSFLPAKVFVNYCILYPSTVVGVATAAVAGPSLFCKYMHCAHMNVLKIMCCLAISFLFLVMCLCQAAELVQSLPCCSYVLVFAVCDISISLAHHSLCGWCCGRSHSQCSQSACN